jgi:hypothetical protein
MLVIIHILINIKTQVNLILKGCSHVSSSGYGGRVEFREAVSAEHSRRMTPQAAAWSLTNRSPGRRP